MAKKKSSILLTIVMLAGGMLMGGAFGFLFGMQMDTLSAAWGVDSLLLTLALMLICLYAAIFLQIILHEGGHLLFGLLTGYSFVSFRIGSLMLIRLDGRLRLKKFSLAGTGGQCLMSPPGVLGEDMPFMLYNFGGVLMNLATALLCALLYIPCRSVPLLSLFLIGMALFGFFTALTNGVPMKGLVNNDGHNALAMRRDPAARRSMWIQLSANAMLAQGKSIPDMPEDWFTLPSDDQLRNSIIAPLGPLRSDYLMAHRRFNEAAALQDRLLTGDNAIVPVHMTLLTCERIYCELMTDNNPDTLSALMTRQYQKSIAAMKGMLAPIRTAYACALLSKQDEAGAAALLSQFEKRARTYPYESEVAHERALMALALEKYQQLHTASC